MGAQQSSARGDSNGQNGSATVAKTCYYEILGIERQATEDEIKKAYRRKALELHPDRNYGDTESATIKFAEVQSAYQVLSDPQERSWYDAHRESILRGGEGDEAEDHFEHNVRLTSARDIVSLISRFNPSISFSDAPNGFYGVLRDTFTTLAKEEEAACNWEGLEFLDYPDFGGAKDDYETVVKPFYGTWINFSTQKTFSWNDAYRPSDAPDRQTRRLIEKENKRLREAGIREFNDAVRSLVAFVRKRDPRYLPNTQSVADREKILRDAAAVQRARARANNQAKLNKHTVPYSGPMHEAAEEEPGLTESEEESEIEQIECVVCGKTFKSEKQYEAHEKSKKHIKAVQQIQREMRKENKLLNLDNPPTTGSGSPVTAFEKLEIDSNDSTAVEYQEEVGENAKSVDGAILETRENGPDEEPQIIPEFQAEEVSDSPDSDDEYASRKDVEDRLVGFPLDSGSNPVAAEIPISATSITASQSEDDIPRQKLGKAKAKRAKKAAKQEKAEQEGQEFKCAECNESFASKTKLFSHIKDFDHAQPVPKAVKGKKRSR